jgi:deoxyribose-phosphate aldolase
MPFKRTVLPNGLVLIDSYDITPQEELEKMTRLCGVVSFPSANHRSALKQKHQCSLAKNQSDEEGI